ncbi:MAG: hypothetical protein Q8M47_03845 [Devosia sp.]|nr:hypothetical protein [Devosia sp.]
MLKDILLNRLDLQEFQIFWFSWILHSYLLSSKSAAHLIELLFNHPSATTICKAKILEIPDIRFGLSELRDGFLGAGQSDWLAWASAVGHRTLKPISRNHKLTYFGKSSPMNHLIHEIVVAEP